MGLGKAIRRVSGNRTSGETAVSLREEPAGSPPNLDLPAIFDAWTYQFTNDPKRREERKRGIFHPSSGLHPQSGLCVRSLMFELLFAPLSPTNIPTRLGKVMDAGTDRHIGLQARFEKLAEAGYMGIVDFKKEVRCIHPWLPLSGSMDGLIVTNAGWRYAVDFKTWSSNNCAKTFEPEWKHRIQLNTYMGIAGVKTGYMWYENKDNQTVIGPPSKFRVNFSNELFEQTEGFCVEVLKLVAHETMPDYDEAICKANIMFCAYTEVCELHRHGNTHWHEFDKRDGETKRRHLKVVT